MSKDTIQRIVGGLQVISGVAGIFYGGGYGAGPGAGNLLGQGIANLEGKDTDKWWHRKGGFGQDVLSSFGVGQLSPNYDPNTPQNKYGAIGQVAGGILGAASGSMSGGSGGSEGGGGGGGYGQWIKLGLKGAMSQQGRQSGGRSSSAVAPAYTYGDLQAQNFLSHDFSADNSSLQSSMVGNGLDFENGQSTIPPEYHGVSNTLSDLLLNYFQTFGQKNG